MDNLTVQQFKAAELAARGCLPLEIAAKLGISTKTLQRWGKKPAFQDFLSEVSRKTREKQPKSLQTSCL